LLINFDFNKIFQLVNKSLRIDQVYLFTARHSILIVPGLLEYGSGV